MPNKGEYKAKVKKTTVGIMIVLSILICVLIVLSFIILSFHYNLAKLVMYISLGLFITGYFPLAIWAIIIGIKGRN